MTDNSDPGRGSSWAYDGDPAGGHSGSPSAPTATATVSEADAYRADGPIFGATRPGAIPPVNEAGSERPEPSGSSADASGRHSRVGADAEGGDTVGVDAESGGSQPYAAEQPSAAGVTVDGSGPDRRPAPAGAYPSAEFGSPFGLPPGQSPEPDHARQLPPDPAPRYATDPALFGTPTESDPVAPPAPQSPPGDPSGPHSGYEPTYDQPMPGQPMPGQPTYDQPAHDQPAYDHPAYAQPGYDHPAYAQPGYAQPGYPDVRAGQAGSGPASHGRNGHLPAPSPQPSGPQPVRPGPPGPHQSGHGPAGPQHSGPHPGSHGPAGQAGFVPGALPTKDQPRPESLLVPSHRASTNHLAEAGWQGRVRRLTGGMVKPQPSSQELADRKDAYDIQRTFSRPMTIVVVQPKGGAGKTPTTIGLASALGAYRGGYVVGWDDNETRGTLAVRVDNADHQSTTVWDLLSDLASFERTDARVGDLSHYVRSQGAAQFDALVSDDSPGNMAQIGQSEYQRLHTVLQRFYRQIVVDTGNNVRSPNWQAAVNSADQIVVVSTYQRDVGYSGSWVLDHLIETGRAELAASAITVLTAADPRQDPAVRSELIDHFRRRTRAVVEIPYDPLIALGGPIEWLRLKPETRQAWVHAGAAVVNALAAQDESERMALRTGG